MTAPLAYADPFERIAEVAAKIAANCDRINAELAAIAADSRAALARLEHPNSLPGGCKGREPDGTHVLPAAAVDGPTAALGRFPFNADGGFDA